jgi:transcriptional regulator GlxA family with amidase domain
VLDGRRATTHWAFSALLASRYPKIAVEADALFVGDGHIYTSAGITAGMDLALSLIEADYGREAALLVARTFVLFLKRPGGQSQFSVQLAGQRSESPAMQKLQSWIVEHLSADLTVEALAQQVSMSPRNFARVFKAELRTSPAAFVEQVRLEAARRSLEDSALGIEAIAVACGFKSPDRMRRAFLRHVGINPVDYRKRFRTNPTVKL